jgi:hypothetical protein
MAGCPPIVRSILGSLPAAINSPIALRMPLYAARVVADHEATGGLLRDHNRKRGAGNFE